MTPSRTANGSSSCTGPAGNSNSRSTWFTTGLKSFAAAPESKKPARKILSPFFSALHVLIRHAQDAMQKGAINMKKQITLASLCLTLAALGHAQQIIVFEVPNAQSTSPNGLLPTGEVIGN